MPISNYIKNIIDKSAWVGELFVIGRQLKAQYGEDKVFDFTVGNPNLLPPPLFYTVLRQTVASHNPELHRYTPNNGLRETREAISAFYTREYEIPLGASDFIITAGASGALNVAFKTLINPGEEIITPSPCFLEYGHFAANHGGVLVPVKTREHFDLDWEKLDTAISSRTKIFLLNSPNNPTGKIYGAGDIQRLGKLLEAKSREFGHSIYLINDEPYRKIIYKNNSLPIIFHYYPDSLIVNSYSKELSIPGERIGWAALNPRAREHDLIMQGMGISNRILGFVNAPGLMQHVIKELQGISVDTKYYEENRDLLCRELAGIGYRFYPPQGAFYLFPEAPGADGMAFAAILRQQLILTIPGGVFGAPGHFRIAFCTDRAKINKAIPGFKMAFEAAGGYST